MLVLVSYDKLGFSVFHTIFAVGWMLLATDLVLSVKPGILMSPLEDPFMDPYIETVCQMSVKEIMTIPKLNDTEFIHYLLDDTQGYFGT